MTKKQNPERDEPGAQATRLSRRRVKVLVADQIDQAGLRRLDAAPGVSFDVRPGLAPSELASIARDYDGMVVRSAVKVTAEVLNDPGRLKAVARAGVGVDNIDVGAATRAGVLVLNTPDANTVAAAEHTVAMMMALCRKIPDAHAHVRSGQWRRGEFMGRQLAGKRLGIVGFGRIGRAVARRALGLEMEVTAYDPFVAKDTEFDGAVTLAPSLRELLEIADILTLHAGLSEDTRAMIGAEQLAWMKPEAMLVNCARGALVDEGALAEALKNGRLAGAALDVYAKEPPVGSPLLEAPRVVLTPHLAASTVEAQQAVSEEAVEALLAYLLDDEIRSAVNVPSFPKHLSARDRQFVDLVDRMGRILSPRGGEGNYKPAGLRRVKVEAPESTLGHLAETLARQAWIGLLAPHLEVRLNLVNAAQQARERGVEIEHVIHGPREGRPEAVTLTVETAQAEPEASAPGHATHTIEGTVYEGVGPRILSIDGYRMEMAPQKHWVLIFNDDRPGVIGLVGQLLGQANVNIADMTLSRRGRTALMLLVLDDPLPDAVRQSLAEHHPPILSIQTISFEG